MKTRVYFTFVIVFMFILSFVYLGQNGAAVALASTQASIALATANTGSHYEVALIVVTLLLLSALWGKSAWHYLKTGETR